MSDFHHLRGRRPFRGHRARPVSRAPHLFRRPGSVLDPPGPPCRSPRQIRRRRSAGADPQAPIRTRLTLTDASSHFQTAHDGHLQIQEDDIACRSRQRREGLPAVGGLRDEASEAFEPASDDEAVHPRVVRDDTTETPGRRHSAEPRRGAGRGDPRVSRARGPRAAAGSRLRSAGIRSGSGPDRARPPADRRESPRGRACLSATPTARAPRVRRGDSAWRESLVGNRIRPCRLQGVLSSYRSEVAPVMRGKGHCGETRVDHDGVLFPGTPARRREE